MENLKKEVAEIAEKNRRVTKELQILLIQKWAEFEKIVEENIDIYSPYYLITVYEGDELYNSAYGRDNKEIWAVYNKDENKIMFEEMEHNGDEWEVISSEHPKYIDRPENIKKTGVVRYARALIAAVKRYKNKLNEATAVKEEMFKEVKEIEKEES